MKKHIQTSTDMSFSNFDTAAFFSGVVESIADPLMQGRVQVRCIGYHPDSKALVPTEDLPWAHVMLPTTSAGVSGIGSTHGLVEGSWVIGFFSDGRSAQQPIVIGSIPGNPNPSRIQQNLLDSGQGIAPTGAEAVSGLMQSTKINNATSVTNGPLGPAITDAEESIDLTSYKEALDAGVISNTQNSTIQKKNLLNLVGVSNDLRSSQIYDTISNNLKIDSNADGKNIISYIEKYSNNDALASAIGASKTPSKINYSANNGLVDVNVNYERALDNSTVNAGLISIEHNNIRRSQTGAPIAKMPNLDQYHFVITAQGQVFPKESLSKSIKKKDNLESIISRGVASNNVRICLIGGLPESAANDNTAGFYERFTKPQFNAAIRLIRTLLKKYPKAIIAGQNSLAKDGSGTQPNFDVTEAFKDIFPNNVNKTSSGSPKVLGTDSVPAATPETFSYVDNTAFQDPRGVYPAVNYGTDYPIIARYNAIIEKKKAPNLIESMNGNISKFSVSEPRNAVDRTAVGIVEPTKLSVPDWGGEYGMAHVIRETPGGHSIIADDTPGKERMIIHSSTGSAIDMRPDGSVTTMSQGKSEELVDGDKIEIYNGDSIETVNGTKRLKIEGDFILEVGGRFAIVAKEVVEFVSGNKSIITEGMFKQLSKAGHAVEVGRDYSLDIGGNRQEITAGTVVDQAGSSRNVVTTGNHTVKSNNFVDMTLGNRTVMTKGNSTQASNGNSSIFAKGDLLATTAGNYSVNSSGTLKQHSGGTSELTAGGKMSLNGSGIGVSSSGANITLDAPFIRMQEGTIADKTTAASIVQYDYPETIQPISTIANPEANPAATDFAFGERHAMEAHEEAGGGGSYGSTRSAFNSGAASNENLNYGAQSNLDPVSLGSSSGTGCQVANGLVQRGMTQEAAAAYAGAFMQESSFNPSVTNRIGATGLAQWTSSGQRKELMQQYLGDRANTIDGQLDYVIYELQNNPNGNAGGAATTWKTNDLNEAIKSAAFYERFNGYESARTGVYTGGEWGNRTGYAASIYQDCFGKDPGQFNPVSGFNAGSLNGTENASGPNTGIGPNGETRGNEKNVNLPPLSDKYTDRNQKISEFFTLDDLLVSGGNKFDMPEYIDTPAGRISADEIVANLSSLAVNVLDVITRRLGRVTVNSGLRPPSYNRKIGGARNSQHMYGRAADITVAGYSPSQVQAYVAQNVPAAHGLGRYRTFTHVDVRPGNRTSWNG